MNGRLAKCSYCLCNYHLYLRDTSSGPNSVLLTEVPLYVKHSVHCSFMTHLTGQFLQMGSNLNILYGECEYTLMSAGTLADVLFFACKKTDQENVLQNMFHVNTETAIMVDKNLGTNSNFCFLYMCMKEKS